MQLSKLARGLQVYKPHATNDHVHTWLWATFKRQWELWPLGFFMGYWVVIFTAASAWTFMKPDVWVNRSNRTPPWQWERAKEYYNKRTKFIDSRQWPIIPDVAELQEKMAAAAAQRRQQ